MSTPRAKVEEIALYLGKPWKFNRLGEPFDGWFEVIDGSGRSLCFRVDDRKFKISGHFPRGKTSPWHDDYQTIGVSIARPAKGIATDIMRRLMPDYLNAYDRAATRYQEEWQKENRLSLMAQTLMKVTGGRLADNSRAARTVYFNKGEAELWSDEEITLTLRKLSIEQAIKISAIVKEGFH